MQVGVKGVQKRIEVRPFGTRSAKCRSCTNDDIAVCNTAVGSRSRSQLHATGTYYASFRFTFPIVHSHKTITCIASLPGASGLKCAVFGHRGDFGGNDHHASAYGAELDRECTTGAASPRYQTPAEAPEAPEAAILGPSRRTADVVAVIMGLCLIG